MQLMKLSKDEAKFTLINGPSQINNYDCALYVIFGVNNIVRDIVSGNSLNINNYNESLQLKEIDLIKKLSLFAYRVLLTIELLYKSWRCTLC